MLLVVNKSQQGGCRVGLGHRPSPPLISLSLISSCRGSGTNPGWRRPAPRTQPEVEGKIKPSSRCRRSSGGPTGEPFAQEFGTCFPTSFTIGYCVYICLPFNGGGPITLDNCWPHMLVFSWIDYYFDHLHRFSLLPGKPLLVFLATLKVIDIYRVAHDSALFDPSFLLSFSLPVFSSWFQMCAFFC